MKKMSKKILAFLLAAVIVIGVAPLNGFVGLELPSLADIFSTKVEATTIKSYSQGDIIEFGWYPQSEVMDSSLISALNNDTSDWISYNYYSGTGEREDGNMTASNYMRYKDVVYGNDKYRGVIFDFYRPNYTGKTSKSTYQDNNGYNTGTVYWFKFEPIEWCVLDPTTGMVMAETILDSQAYNNYILYSGGDEYNYWAYWGEPSKTYYANNYAESSIREWLNNVFYNTAFSTAQQDIIQYTTLDNSAYDASRSAFDSASTTDKIYLLSYDDALNTNYGFSSDDDSCIAQASNYAKCQGLYAPKNDSGGFNWYLRSAGYRSNDACGVSYFGHISSYANSTDSTSYGVRPALNFNLTSEIIQSNGSDVDISFLKDTYYCLADESIVVSGDIYVEDNIDDLTLSWNCSDGVQLSTPALIEKSDDNNATFRIAAKGISPGVHTVTVLTNLGVYASCEIIVKSSELEFQEDSYAFTVSNAEIETDPIKLNWKAEVSGDEFDPDKLTLSTNDKEIADVAEFTYSQVGDTVEISVEIKPLTNGECTLSAWYKGAVDSCIIKVEKADIMVYTTQPSLMIDVGEKMGMGFAISKDGKVEEWKNMAIVISNPTVVDVSDYIYSEQGYYINFTGKKEGTTTVTVTDSDSGAYVTFLIKVASEDALCRSYKIDKIPEYYPEIWGCRETKTNFYDVSGLYVNQYKQGALKSNGKYPVSFNVYNSEYHYGSVDVYDANGKWVQSVCIDKYAMMPESVLETADQLFYLITDGLSFDWFSYEANHFSKKTTVEIEVPKGGYFTITNNIANSPGTVLYNTADFMSTVLSGSITLDNMNNAVDEVVKDIISDDAVYDAFMSALMNIGVNVANQSLTVGVGTASNALVTDVEGVFESLGLGFNSFCSTAAGIAQDVFTSFDTPFGKALELCFKISELSNTTCQMLNLLNSDDNVYLAIHTNESAQNHVMNGVVVDDSGNAIDREAVLQVFRVTDVSMKDIVISNDTTLKFDDYVTYNICFVKNETEVQPNGKVQVKIPIPEGMDKSDCCILRQEKNGKWTVLNARVDGNYLVFETEHFSLYAVAGNYADSIKINSMPAKLDYNFGEYIDTTDMSIEVTYDDGRTETITEGIICTPARLAEGGTQVITVSYGKTTTTFTVEVASNIKFSAAIAEPSTTTIKYGDSIILHAEITGELPAGAVIEWSTDNGCFEKVASNDGMTCKITPKSSGNTTITIRIVSAEGEVIAEDTQTMTSKAGFLDKIIGFFKKLFGLTKTIPQYFKAIF